MPTNRLYNIWFQRIEQRWPHLRVTQRRNLTNLIIGIYLSKSVALNAIALKIPSQAVQVSIQRRMSRILGNSAIRVRDCYDPEIEPLLAEIGKNGVIRILVDGSKVGNNHQLLMVSVAYRRRSVPVVWTWVRAPRGHSSSKKQLALLSYLRKLLPDEAEVLLLGDSEFGAVDVIRQVEKWNWDYVLRQKSSHLVQLADGKWKAFGDFAQKAGESIWLGKGLLTQKHAHSVNLLAHWKKGEDTPWLLATNLKTRKATIKGYKVRMWIEIVCTQMTKARVFTIRAGWDNITDFYFFVVYNHSIDQQFYQLPALFKIQITEGRLNALAKFLNVVCQCQGLNLLFGLLLYLSQLLLETILGLSQFLAFALKFVARDDFR